MACVDVLECEGVRWIRSEPRKKPRGPYGEDLGMFEPSWYCEAMPSVKVVRYPLGGSIFQGWCLLSGGSGIHRSGDADVTKEECMRVGNAYVARRCEERLTQAHTDLHEAEDSFALVAHITPEGD